MLFPASQPPVCRCQLVCAVQALQAHLVAQGVKVLAFKGGIRMVTHCDVSADDVRAALAALRKAEAACENGHPAADGAKQEVLQNGHVKPEFKAY